MSTTTTQFDAKPVPGPQPTLRALNDASNYSPHHVQTKLQYYGNPDDGSLPEHNNLEKLEKLDSRPMTWVPVEIKDVRGEEELYTLDGQGFQYLKHTTANVDFKSDDQIMDVYYKEIEQLLLRVYASALHIRNRHDYISH